MKRKTIIIIEIISIILIYFFVNSSYISLIPKCWVYQNTNLLCPSCGGTRCIKNLFQGNFIQAFHANQVIFLGILYLSIINIVYLFNIGKEDKKLTWIYLKWWYAIIFIIILIIYTIIRNICLL